MPTDSTQFSLVHVTVDGLEANSRAVAEQEIRSQCEVIRRFAVPLQQNVEISVHLTDDLAAAVDRFRAGQDDNHAPYDRSRLQGTSLGIVLPSPSEASTAAHTLIVDASLWVEQSPAHVVLRTYGLARLLGTLVNHHDLSQQELLPPSFSGHHAEELWHAALTLRSTLDDALLALDICGACLRNQNGNAILVADYLGDALISGSSEMLDMLCVFATFDIGLYRGFSIGDVDELYKTGPQLAFALTQSLVESIAVFGVASRFSELYDMLLRCNGFQEFVAPVWTDLNGCVVEQDEAMLAGFGRVLNELLSRLGLRIEDLEGGGVWLHVHEPVICKWNEDPQLVNNEE